MNRVLKLWRVLTSGYRKPLQVLGALLAALLLGDFWLRVYVPRDPALRVFASPPKVDITAPPAAAAVATALELWLPTVPVVEAPKEREISLQGIFRSGGTAIAALILRDPASGAVEVIRTTVGQVVEGWTVETIEARKVVLRKGEQSRELVLFRAPAQ